MDKPKLSANQYNAMMRLNSVLSRFSNYRTLFDGVTQGGYHGADTFRNVWTAFGYAQSLTFDNYWNMALRLGLAYACIYKPVKKRWSIYPKVYDEPYEEDGKTIKREPTKFEAAVQRLADEFDFWGVMKELDECQRFGLYGGVLILGKESGAVKDLKNTPLYINGINRLISLTPCFESQIDLSSSDKDTDMQSERYGLPKWYTWKEGVGVEGSSYGTGVSQNQEIHWTRAFLHSESAMGNNIVGRPALMQIYNSLQNWEKLCGASAESYFKNSKMPLNMDVTDQSLAQLLFSAQENDTQTGYNDMMEEFFRGYNNSLDTAGVEAKVLQTAIADPTGPAGVILQDICSGIEAPKTELIGFETGERSSTENANSWNVTNQSWRTTKGTKQVVKALKHLVKVGVLPEPSQRIMVDWPDIGSPSIEQRVTNGVKITTMIKDLQGAGLEAEAQSVAANLLPDALDIEIEKTPTDSIDDGLDDEDTDTETPEE